MVAFYFANAVVGFYWDLFDFNCHRSGVLLELGGREVLASIISNILGGSLVSVNPTVTQRVPSILC